MTLNKSTVHYRYIRLCEAQDTYCDEYGDCKYIEKRSAGKTINSERNPKPQQHQILKTNPTTQSSEVTFPNPRIQNSIVFSSNFALLYKTVQQINQIIARVQNDYLKPCMFWDRNFATSFVFTKVRSCDSRNQECKKRECKIFKNSMTAWPSWFKRTI